MFKNKLRKNKNILGEDIYEIKCQIVMSGMM